VTKKTSDRIKIWAPRGLMMVAMLAIGYCTGAGCAQLQKAAPVIRALCPKCGDVLDLFTHGDGTEHVPATPPAATAPPAAPETP